MLQLDGLFDIVLALAALALAANIAFAVLVWVYAAVFIGATPIAGILALIFIAFGSTIVVGFGQLYLA